MRLIILFTLLLIYSISYGEVFKSPDGFIVEIDTITSKWHPSKGFDEEITMSYDTDYELTSSTIDFVKEEFSNIFNIAIIEVSPPEPLRKNDRNEANLLNILRRFARKYNANLIHSLRFISDKKYIYKATAVLAYNMKSKT